MQYRRLGQSALKLSALSYGSWITFGTTLDDRAARDCLACAYDHGINSSTAPRSISAARPSACWAAPSRRWAGRATAIACRARRCTAPPTIMRREAGRADAAGPEPQAPGRGLRAGAAALRAGLSGPVPVPSTGPGHVDPGNRLDHAHAGATGQDPVLGHFGMAGGRHRDAVRLCRAPRPGAAAAGAAAACSIASASSTSTVRWSSGAGWG